MLLGNVFLISAIALEIFLTAVFLEQPTSFETLAIITKPREVHSIEVLVNTVEILVNTEEIPLETFAIV